MSILTNLKEQTIAAMKAKDASKLKVLRTLSAKLKQYEVDNNCKGELTEELVISILRKLKKQGQESLNIYKEQNRDDLVAKEAFEIDIITSFLPQEMPVKELEELIDSIIQTVGNTKDKFGSIVKSIKEKSNGLANMQQAASIIKSKLK